MIELDGSLGEGGGQILRSALTLSVVTGLPFELKRIRAGRRRPGLLRQHLLCVEAATAISGARTEGAVSNSQTLRFTPGPARAGDHAFRLASAGSSTLVFQTVVPALLRSGKRFTLDLEGGTHNSAAPSFDFIARTYAPCLEAVGVSCQLRLQRRGYYPAGGGQWRAVVTPPATPAGLKPLCWLKRETTGPVRARLLLSRMAARIAERERDLLLKGLQLPPDAVVIEIDETSPGPGCVGLIDLPASPVPETVTLYGGYGSHTDEATLAAIEEVKAFQGHDAPVGQHLADQLMVLLLTAAGGAYRTGPLTPHAETHLQVIEAFAPGHVRKSIEPDGCVVLEIKAL